MIPWECRHSIALAISSAKPIATCLSKHLGRMLNKYFRNVPPNNSSVTITITGSLHAPINCWETEWQYLLSLVQNLAHNKYSLYIMHIFASTTYNKHKYKNQGRPKPNSHLHQILMLHSRQHCHLPCEAPFSLGNVFCSFSFMYNFNSNSLVFVSETNPAKESEADWQNCNPHKKKLQNNYSDQRKHNSGPSVIVEGNEAEVQPNSN